MGASASRANFVLKALDFDQRFIDDLFEIMISASYGTLTHAFKGNVDIMIALVMHTGAAIGAQIGATLTQHFAGPRIRLAFVPLPLIGAGLIIYGLLNGTQLK